MDATTTLEELTEGPLERAHVQRRVDDWAARLDALYADIEAWLPPGWTARPGRPAAMDEGPMREVGIAARKLPTLEVLAGQEVHLTIRPEALWIIGLNGRLVLVRRGEIFFVSDIAHLFERPIWELVPMSDRSDEKPFDQRSFRDLVAR